MKVLKGRDIKKQFVSENKEQIRQYMSYVMTQEDKMLGYMEFTNTNQNEKYQIQQRMKEEEQKKISEEKEKLEEIKQLDNKQMRKTVNDV